MKDMLKRFPFLVLISLNSIFLISSETKDDEDVFAKLIPGSGSYTREISTENARAQEFFDQGLRFAWGFYFPESIASYQEASRLDPLIQCLIGGLRMLWGQIQIHDMPECLTIQKAKD